MVTILSSHQQNTMVSTFNVLLLTLNKALPGGLPRIARHQVQVQVWGRSLKIIIVIHIQDLPQMHRTTSSAPT